MRLRSRSLRQITGRCRDFHAFTRTRAERITSRTCVQRVYRDGQIGGGQKKAECELYICTNDTHAQKVE